MNLVNPDPQRSILLYCIVYILFAEERLLVVLYNAHMYVREGLCCLHIHCTTWGNNILKSQWPSILSIQSRESADS